MAPPPGTGAVPRRGSYSGPMIVGRFSFGGRRNSRSCLAKGLPGGAPIGWRLSGGRRGEQPGATAFGHHLQARLLHENGATLHRVARRVELVSVQPHPAVIGWPVVNPDDPEHHRLEELHARFPCYVDDIARSRTHLFHPLSHSRCVGLWRAMSFGTPGVRARYRAGMTPTVRRNDSRAVSDTLPEDRDRCKLHFGYARASNKSIYVTYMRG